MLTSMPDGQFAALLETLESVLCNPDKRAEHLRRLAPETWDREPLPDEIREDVLTSDARLAALNPTDLQRLNRNPAALILLARQIAASDAPAWHRPLAAAAARDALRRGMRMPTWEELTARPLPGEEESFATDDELVASLAAGPKSEPFTKGRRPLVFEWPWDRAQMDLNWISGGPASGTEAQRRTRTSFSLQAFAASGNRTGCWTLTLNCAVSGTVSLTVSLTGWGGTWKHSAQVTPSAGEPIELTGWGDPTAHFEGWNTGGLKVRIRCDGPTGSWEDVETVPSGSIDEPFYNAWKVDNYFLCYRRLLTSCLIMARGRDEGPTQEFLDRGIDRVRQRRHVYGSGARQVQGFAHFSKLVLSAAKTQYLDWARSNRRFWTSTDRVEELLQTLKPDLPRREEMVGALRESLSELAKEAPKPFLALHHYRFEGKKYEEVAHDLNCSTAHAWNLVSKATQRLLELMSPRGFDAGDLDSCF